MAMPPAYAPDDASWPALVAMLNEFLLDQRALIFSLRQELAQRDREVTFYRKQLEFWFDNEAKEVVPDKTKVPANGEF